MGYACWTGLEEPFSMRPTHHNSSLFQLAQFSTPETRIMEEVERYLAITWEMRNMERISGLAWVEVDRKRIGIGQFIDSKQYTELETAILQNWTESTLVLMPAASDYEGSKVKDVLRRCNITALEMNQSMKFHLFNNTSTFILTEAPKLKETYDTLCGLVGGDKCASSLGTYLSHTSY